jgi:hypothetical protein
MVGNTMIAVDTGKKKERNPNPEVFLSEGSLLTVGSLMFPYVH